MLINVILGRAAIYEYLSMAFSGIPDEKFIGLSGKFAGVFAEIAMERGNASMAKGAELLAGYAEYEARNDSKFILDKCNMEYTGIFLLGDSGVSLTESVNRTAERLNKQEPWESVINIYRARGFKVPADFKEPEDHISMEFLFMRDMCRLAADLFKDGTDCKVFKILKEQQRFLSDHLICWVPRLCRDGALIARRRGSVLYEAVFLITEGFIPVDDVTLSYLIE